MKEVFLHIGMHKTGTSTIQKSLHGYNKNGIKIETGDIDSMADAIQYYIDNKNMIKIHGDESYNIVKNYFPEVVFKQLSQLYNSI